MAGQFHRDSLGHARADKIANGRPTKVVREASNQPGLFDEDEGSVGAACGGAPASGAPSVVIVLYGEPVRWNTWGII